MGGASRSEAVTVPRTRPHGQRRPRIRQTAKAHPGRICCADRPSDRLGGHMACRVARDNRGRQKCARGSEKALIRTAHAGFAIAIDRGKAAPPVLERRHRRGRYGGLTQTGPSGSRSAARHTNVRRAAARVRPRPLSRTANKASSKSPRGRVLVL